MTPVNRTKFYRFMSSNISTKVLFVVELLLFWIIFSSMYISVYPITDHVIETLSCVTIVCLLSAIIKLSNNQCWFSDSVSIAILPSTVVFYSTVDPRIVVAFISTGVLSATCAAIVHSEKNLSHAFNAFSITTAIQIVIITIMKAFAPPILKI